MNREDRRKTAKTGKELNKRTPRTAHKRVLWASNAPWASTGYGQQTSQVVRRMAADKHEVAVAANYGLEAAPTVWNADGYPIKVYPRGQEQWSNDVIPAHMHEWSSRAPELSPLLVTLFDVWVFKGPRWADWPVLSWVPVDHMPAPAEVSAWLRQSFVTPLAMSKYGKSMIENVGIEAEYAPHAIEKEYLHTTSFETSDGQTTTGRELMGIPEDRFVVSMVANNKGVYPCRKAFGENLLAFSMLAQKHDDAVLYLHTERTSSTGGINLDDLVKSVGIPENQIVYVNQYQYRHGLPVQAMAALYSATDILLATSMGEGFGIPCVEAARCGSRVIVSDFAASAELVGDGFKVSGQPLWDAPQRSFFFVPSVPGILDALENAYQQGRYKSDKAIEWSAQYDADLVYSKHWKPLLARL